MSTHNEPEEIQPNIHVEDGLCGTTQSPLFYCESCGNIYGDNESYAKDHSHQSGCCVGGIKKELEFVEEFISEEQTEVPASLAEEDNEEEIHEADVPLWEVVDDPIKADENETDPTHSDRYFCYDCHSIFENRSSAEDHVCPQADTGGGSIQHADEIPAGTAKPPTRRKLPSVAARTDSKGSSQSSVISCEICNTVFSSAKFLKFHMRIHEKVAPKSIQDALPVGAHQQYSKLDQFYCEICNKSFDENLLTVHKQMHQETAKEFMCGVCNRQFFNSIDYDMHLKIHQKPRDLEATRMPEHRSTAGDKEKPGFPCQYCERVFSRPYEKVKHERVHTGEKPYSCEVCGKTFRVSYSLTLHLRTHTNIRPYVCTVCNKRFKSHQVYSHHLRIHSTERQFACDVCSKSFRTSVQLYAHKNTHTKPYQCVVCNRPFSSMYAVRIHMQTHEDEKSKGNGKGVQASTKSQPSAGKFWCSSCGAEYARMFALRMHMKTAHGLTEEVIQQEENSSTALEDVLPTVVDSETAVLIAAAEADAAYINAVVNAVDVVGSVPTYEEVAVEFDVDNFHSEEIITDWLK
ncbi:zinc finger protein ZFP2 [Drosophila kikkawai]|uniref:Zinc finger protein ZFP2 n=1 Tax=Drosophila kikkawai TaxID=30033 RepID=A0A6P4IN64_DROKI|nr:zinc finger protein 2 isoform X1 [Drosophila kikkawai]